VAAFNKTARQSSEGVRPHNPIGDRRPKVEISNGRVLTKKRFRKSSPIHLLLDDDTASHSERCAGIDRIALAHLTVEDDRAGSLVPDLDAELVDPTSARELSVNDG
jgi:hypothetical protein